jgi:PhnB protein
VALGARILLSIKDQFYGDRAGSIADPFEQAWTIATHKEDLSPEESSSGLLLPLAVHKCA